MEVGFAAIEVLVQNMINVLKDEYLLIQGLEENAQQLQTTMGIIQAYLNDAANKSITQDVKIWLAKLEVVAFDADNVLDELSYDLLRKKIKKMKTPTANNKMLSCFSACSHFPRRRNMAHTIKQINTNFESMSTTATNLGLQSKILNAPIVARTSIQTSSIKIDPIFVGRDDDVSNIVDMLNHIPQDQTISIVAIVGMGGMGKTTLTRNVFNHESLKTFGSHIWVHVSRIFDSIGLYNKIHSTLTSTTSDRVEIKEVILNKLKELLMAKTYLLVLDDVWNEDVPIWEDFINNMEGVSSTKGNGIIITTRIQNVASIVNPFRIHPVNGLSNEECWSIIKTKAFDGNAEVPSGYEMIGKQIAERCQGLPLAANVVGGVLCRKSVQDWRTIKDNWLSDGEEGNSISTILKLSYDHLSSPSLKKCFAFCSIFPKGHVIMKEELIELWMAEGFLFLQPSQKDDMESVGNMFLNVLLQNSLLQAAKTDYYGRQTCVMHDLVHDIASSVLSNNADGNTRYKFHEKELSRIPEEVSRNLRTLLLRDGTSGTIFSDFKCLHNLTLYGGEFRELPISIKELIHLRNLNISKTFIANIPEWIGELHHLQTLRSVRTLNPLPNTLKYLINLRHLCLESETELPAEIGKLTNLQTLWFFNVGKEKGYQIEELGSLKRLKGTLKIQHLERVCDKEEAMKAKMLDKSNLSKLMFSWAYSYDRQINDESVLEGLQPHANLEVLEIEGFEGKRFPRWIEKMEVSDVLRGSWVPLDNLTELTLRNCSECEEIPMLEHLSNLKSLYLSGLKKVRVINSSFKNLKTLVISGLPLTCLPEQLFYNNQNLSTLTIEDCHVLIELPDGLDTLNSLEELSIRNCKTLKSIENSSGRVRNYQGILHKLRVEGCEKLIELPCQILESSAPTIKTLVLEELKSLRNLPMLIDCLARSSPRLEALTIKGVPNFMASGRVESWDLGRLKKLYIDVSVEWSMESSDAIGATVEGMLQGCANSLTHFYLKGVENWEWLPQSIQHPTALSWLELENIGVQELPQWLGNLSSVRWLFLVGFEKLRCLPDTMKRLTLLHQLGIEYCPVLCIDSEWRKQLNFIIKVYNGVDI